MNRFIDVIPSRCIGCRTCEIVCALSHAGSGGNVNVSAAASGAGSGDGDVLACLGSMPRLTVIKGENVCMPVTCHHCDDAPCAAACPTGAISHVESTVQVDQSRCIGCKSCSIACPYGMMDIVAIPSPSPYAGIRLSLGAKVRAQKCDLCIERPQGPACVQNCPTKALLVANETDIRDTMQQRRQEAMLDAIKNEARP